MSVRVMVFSRQLENFRSSCGVDDDVSDRCPPASSPKQCRSAVVALMGSQLTSNCTCVQRDAAQLLRCLQLRRQLQRPNACIGNSFIQLFTTLFVRHNKDP